MSFLRCEYESCADVKGEICEYVRCEDVRCEDGRCADVRCADVRWKDVGCEGKRRGNIRSADV